MAGVQHLAAKGRQRIALLNGDMRYLYSQQREQGYRQALAELGLDYCRVEYVEGLDYAAGAKAMSDLLADGPRPDAVFAISDVIAGGAMSALHQQGLRIPEDIAVMGFDGVPFGSITTPPLTTIVQPMHQFGVRSVAVAAGENSGPAVAPLPRRAGLATAGTEFNLKSCRVRKYVRGHPARYAPLAVRKTVHHRVMIAAWHAIRGGQDAPSSKASVCNGRSR